MKKICFLILIFLILVGCSNNSEIEQLKKENEQLREQITLEDSKVVESSVDET